MPGDLKTISVDVRTGELLINGLKQENVTYMQLTFSAGIWDLSIQQHKLYGVTGKSHQEESD